jgi:hypothetical protein
MNAMGNLQCLTGIPAEKKKKAVSFRTKSRIFTASFNLIDVSR